MQILVQWFEAHQSIFTLQKTSSWVPLNQHLNDAYQTTYNRLVGFIRPIPIDLTALSHQYTETNTYVLEI